MLTVRNVTRQNLAAAPPACKVHPHQAHPAMAVSRPLHTVGTARSAALLSTSRAGGREPQIAAEADADAAVKRKARPCRTAGLRRPGPTRSGLGRIVTPRPN